MLKQGLRTGNIYSPWPEEGNRKLTGAIADLHFAPTETSKQNLLQENIDPEKIIVTGNTVIDALLEVIEKLETNVELKSSLQTQFDFLDENKRLVLITGHRRKVLVVDWNAFVKRLHKWRKHSLRLSLCIQCT